MEYTVPDYYRKFACTAGECPDTCCAGWQIMIDGRSLKKYRKYKGAFGNRLRNGIDWEAGAFRQYRGRCEFLNEENLCDIYTEAGSELLCRTCRRYPRHVEEYEGLREISLSLSCPVAAALILREGPPVRFLHGRGPGEETYGNFDCLLFSALLDAREYLLEILQDRRAPVELRMAKALVWARDFQRAMDRRELFRAQELRELHQRTGCTEKFADKVHAFLGMEKRKKSGKDGGRYALMQELWERLLPPLEVLRPEWPGFLKRSRELLYCGGEQAYLEKRKRFAGLYSAWEQELEQLLVYWVFTYFCGAVYDGSAYTKMKLAAAAVLLIQDWDLAVFLEKDGFSKEDQIRICSAFSRELEHSDRNLDIFERAAGDEQAFGLKRLLACLVC